MILFPVFSSGDSYFVSIDTNGEKGPTRTNIDTSYSGGSVSPSWASPYYDATFNNPSFSISENTTIAANERNGNPDIILFIVNIKTNEIKPVGQRTRNILATGNATISK